MRSSSSGPSGPRPAFRSTSAISAIVLPSSTPDSPDFLDRPPAEVEQVVPAPGAQDLQHTLALLIALDRHVHDVPPVGQGVGVDPKGVGLVAVPLAPAQELAA